ncbi:MAG: DUF2189 domain-containing protein [Acetobacteraceae bacterium]
MPVIRNPVLVGWDWVKGAASAVDSVAHDEPEAQHALRRAHPEVRRIGIGDIRAALAAGLADFGAARTDIVLLCVIYPVAGLVFGRLAFGYGVLPLLFPLVAGFALIGPFAAIGLYELSRRREQGAEIGWGDAFGVFRSPSFGAILRLGIMLTGLFLLWLVVAQGLYDLTLGPDQPVSAAAFFHDVFHTWAGWILIVVGVGIGFLFAVVAMAISVVSFPMLLDRADVTVETAIGTSLRAVRTNKGTMAVWGFVVVAGLVIGSIPLLIGLAIVMPVLGHATWHLYCRLVVSP